jgi:hypothetical protein
MHSLEVPEAFTCGCVEGQLAISIEIISNSVAAVEVEYS